MMGFFNPGPHDGNRFMAMLGDHASRAAHAIHALEDSLAQASDPAVERLRGEAAALTEQRRVLIDELQHTFVTPLDREDIYNLSQSFEKMAGYALTTIEEMRLLHVDCDEPVRQMVALVREQAEELEAAMRRLGANPRVACDHANRVHDKEREVERIYRAAIRELFSRAYEPQALPAIMYRREVYRHISNMSDRAVSAADVLGMIVMKIA